MRRALLLCWLALLGACGHMTRQEGEAAGTAPLHEPLHAGVDRLVQPVLAAHETPGLIVGVATPDGRRHFFSYGRGETGGGPLAPDTRFPIGSLTKGYVGALLAVLVDEGQLHWEDTLIWLLPVKRQDPVLCGADIELNLLPDGERDGA